MKKLLSIFLLVFILLNTSLSFAWDFQVETKLSTIKQESYKKQIDSVYKNFENKLSKLNEEKQISNIEKVVSKIDVLLKKKLSDKNNYVLSYLNYLLKYKLNLLLNEDNINIWEVLKIEDEKVNKELTCKSWTHKELNKCVENIKSCNIENWTWIQKWDWNKWYECMPNKCNDWYINNTWKICSKIVSQDVSDKNITDNNVIWTEISWIIKENTTLTLDKSPYIVVNDIIINKDIIFNIEPWVVIKFKKIKDRGFYIINKWKITARWTYDKNIIFTSNSNLPKLWDWDSIETIDLWSIDFEYVNVEYAQNWIASKNALNTKIKNSLIQKCWTSIFTKNSAIITDNIIKNNYRWIIHNYWSPSWSWIWDYTKEYEWMWNLIIDNNDISNNESSIKTVDKYHAWIVIWLTDKITEVKITNNAIYNNYNWINFIGNLSNNIIIDNNNIFDNSYYNIWFFKGIYSKNSIKFSNIYWWDIDESIIKSKIYDYNFDYVTPLPKTILEWNKDKIIDNIWVK